jgi:drug/metabolite transporter (DMT)-like permease
MSYIGFAIASAGTFAISILLVKYISKYIIQDSNSLFFWSYLPTLPFVLFIPLWQGWQFDWNFILPIIIQALLLSSGVHFYLKGLKQTDASVIRATFNSIRFYCHFSWLILTRKLSSSCLWLSIITNYRSHVCLSHR